MFFSTFFHFHHTIFRGLVGACVNPKSIFQTLFVHSLVCPITHSFLIEFQPNFYLHFSYVRIYIYIYICPTCHTIFSLKKTLECVCERLLHCRLIVVITWTPINDLQELLHIQSILMYHSICSESYKRIAGFSFSKCSICSYASTK